MNSEILAVQELNRLQIGLSHGKVMYSLCIFGSPQKWGVLDPCLRFEASKSFINSFDNKSSILSLIFALYSGLASLGGSLWTSV